MNQHPFSGPQLSPVRNEVKKAADASREYKKESHEYARLQLKEISVNENSKWLALLLIFALWPDMFVAFALMAGELTAFGQWGDVIVGTLACIIACTAVGLELAAKYFLTTAPSQLVRIVAFCSGMLPALAIVYLVGSMRRQVDAILGEGGAGIDGKLLVFGGLAVLAHLLLFVSGDRVINGIGQVYLWWKLSGTHRKMDRLERRFQEAVRGALEKSHDIAIQAAALGVEIVYDEYTAEHLHRWKREIRHFGRVSIMPVGIILPETPASDVRRQLPPAA
jgi:hypothetical protein